MCGLVGVAGNLAIRDEKLMKHLFMFDYFRGPDSTGLAAIRGNGDAFIAKLASHPINLFDTGRFKTALNGNTSRAFIGHNRATTRGATNDVNAHPFIFGHIIGAHNGTLQDACIGALEEAAGDKFNVDSQALFAAIAAVGVDAAIPMAQGAWSLSWYDMQEGTLNFLRNSERPLWYAFTADFTRLIWASQWEFIHAAALSNDIDLHTFVDGDRAFQFRQTEENVVYSFDLKELGTTKALPKPKCRKLEGKPKYVPQTGNYSGGSNVTNFFRPQPQTTTSTTSGGTRNSSGGTRNSTGTERKTNSSILHRTGTDQDPFAGIVDFDEFARLAKGGCTWCQSPVHWGDTGIVILENASAVIGPCCTERSGTNRVLTQVDLMLEK